MATLFTKEQTAYNISGSSLNYTFKLEVIENSTNTDANTSNVTVNLYGKTNNSVAGYEGYNQPKAAISIDGSQVANATVSSIISQTYKVIATYTGNITHSEDGTKTIAVVGAFAPNSTTSYLPKAASISGNVALTNIDVQAKVNIKVNGTWKQGKVWIKVNGNWVKAKKVYIKASNTWKKAV